MPSKKCVERIRKVENPPNHAGVIYVALTKEDHHEYRTYPSVWGKMFYCIFCLETVDWNG